MGDHTITPDPDDPIDRAVLEFQKGIRRVENYEIIVKRYYKPVRAFFGKRELSKQDCEDLTQKTFLKVYTGMDGYRWNAKFSSWLFTIAVNEYRNWRDGESRRGRGFAPVNDPPDESGGGGEAVEIDVKKDPLEELLSEEQARLLREAVDELPPKMRECVEWRLRDLSYQEIADKMGLSIGTVKAHLSVAREKLRDKLGDFFDGIDF